MLPIRDTVPAQRQRFPPVMIALLLANVAVFLYQISLSPEELDGLILRYGVIPTHFTSPGGVQTHDLLTLITSIFLHGGWFHLIGNMWYLWIFGDNVEDRLGHFRFLLFYLTGGVAANGAHILLSPHSPIPGVGASGAIAAVLGAYLVLFPHARIVTIVPIFILLYVVELPAIIVLGFWFVFQFFSGLGSLTTTAGALQGGVAYWAHVGGFLFGMILLLFFRPRRARWDRAYQQRREWRV